MPSNEPIKTTNAKASTAKSVVAENVETPSDRPVPRNQILGKTKTWLAAKKWSNGSLRPLV